MQSESDRIRRWQLYRKLSATTLALGLLGTMPLHWAKKNHLLPFNTLNNLNGIGIAWFVFVFGLFYFKTQRCPVCREQFSKSEEFDEGLPTLNSIEKCPMCEADLREPDVCHEAPFPPWPSEK